MEGEHMESSGLFETSKKGIVTSDSSEFLVEHYST